MGKSHKTHDFGIRLCMQFLCLETLIRWILDWHSSWVSYLVSVCLSVGMYTTEEEFQREWILIFVFFFYSKLNKDLFFVFMLSVKRAAQRRINMNVWVPSCGRAVDCKFIILSCQGPRSMASTSLAFYFLNMSQNSSPEHGGTKHFKLVLRFQLCTGIKKNLYKSETSYLHFSPTATCHTLHVALMSN